MADLGAMETSDVACLAALADDVMVARALRITPSFLAAYIMFPNPASGLDAILNSRTLALPGAILKPNAVPWCEHNDRGGGRITYLRFCTRVGRWRPL